MSRKPDLRLVQGERRKRTFPSIAQLNDTDVREGDIVAFVACLSFDARDESVPFDPLLLATRLREQLHAIAGHVPNDAFIEIASICGELLNNGTQAILADHMASIAVAEAKRGDK